MPDETMPTNEYGISQELYVLHTVAQQFGLETFASITSRERFRLRIHNQFLTATEQSYYCNKISHETGDDVKRIRCIAFASNDGKTIQAHWCEYEYVGLYDPTRTFSFGESEKKDEFATRLWATETSEQIGIVGPRMQ